MRQAVASAVTHELGAVGHTEAWLAQRSGVSPRALDSALRMRRDFTVTELAAIAAALQIPIARIVPPLPPQSNQNHGADRQKGQ